MLVSQYVMQARMRTDLRVDFFYINQLKSFFSNLAFRLKCRKEKITAISYGFCLIAHQAQLQLRHKIRIIMTNKTQE